MRHIFVKAIYLPNFVRLFVNECFSKIKIEMQRRLLTLLAICLVALTTAFAQHKHDQRGQCGTVHPEDLAILKQRLFENKAFLVTNPVQERTTKYVPVKFHLVAQTDGNNRVSLQDVLNQLCALNEDFAPMDIQFYISNGFNNINNTAMYSNHSSTTTVMNFNKANNAMNIYVVNDATPTGDGLGTTLGYYSPGRDWIVIRKSETNGPSATLPHEVGHFFSLMHPHNGWDAVPYSAAMHGNPVQPNSPGPGFVPNERQDGSNCNTAGDFICDTPPDYNFGFGWPNCNYNAGTMDPLGVIVNPDEKLMMAYFLSCPRAEYYFSPQQQAVVAADYASNRRAYIRSSFVPSTTPITQMPALVAPVGGVTVSGFNAVNFQWSPAEHAQAYVLEISRVSNFTLSPIRMVVYGTNKVVNNLEANRTYFWRVRPFSDGYHCTSSTANGTFSTNNLTSSGEPSFVNAWSVTPNPVQRGQQLNIKIESQTNFTAQIALYSLTGQRLLHVASQRFNAGANEYNLDVADLPAGVYVMVVDAPEGQLKERVVVMK